LRFRSSNSKSFLVILQKQHNKKGRDRDVDSSTLRRLKKLRDELTSLIDGVEKTNGTQQESHWHVWFRRAGAVLNDVDQAGGAVDKETWRQIGLRLGYDPRGLAGFYTGSDPSMHRDPDSDQRILTERGRLEAANWRRLFGGT
jgi:hypothetical protein